MKTAQQSLAILLLIFAVSCGQLFLGADPENAPESNFDVLWNDFDKTYAFFEIKNVDWNLLYNQYRPQVSQVGLERAVAGMLAQLKDGHVNVSDRGRIIFSYDGWHKNYPANFIGLVRSEVSYHWPNRTIQYAAFPESVGYVYISSFGNDSQEYTVIDQIINEFQSLKGIIIDVRHNGGGSTKNARRMASRFADRKRIASYFRLRNGPRHSDFTDFISRAIAPEGKKQYTKPVVVLTNRWCFSATEVFILMMKSFPHVTTIGDTTGGGAGNPIFRELPNGWTYSVPRSIVYTADKKSFEDIGLPPDMPMRITPADSVAKRDVILEAAIQRLK